MGYNRFTLFFSYQIGIRIGFDQYAKALELDIPFFGIIINFTKYAKGVELFGKWFKY